MERSAGILMPVFSLPSEYGIGCFDSAAYRFIDFLSEAKQSVWQVLPLGPTGYGDSPYQSPSLFAGNPYFISIEGLIEKGWLSASECAELIPQNDTSIDYGHIFRSRNKLLRTAYERSGMRRSPKLEQFRKMTPWIEDYALFSAIKSASSFASLSSWDPTLRKREEPILSQCREMLEDEITYACFLQYLFYEEWHALHRYANASGIRIIGDLPIYCSYDSADTWSAPSLFQLDGEHLPTAVAGCPPDGFSPNGQLWGNPLYRWERHEETNFAWWIERFTHAFSLYDGIRIDHFRGFDSCYSIPYGSPDARGGHWEHASGAALFARLRRVLGERELIAEDLGFITDSVRALLAYCRFPCMRVIEFGFDIREGDPENEHLPHVYPENCVAYTGTHDNAPLIGWLECLSDTEMQNLRGYLQNECAEIPALANALIAEVMKSRAYLAIVPIWDWLLLDNTARLNTPASDHGNWRFRISKEMLSQDLCQKIAHFTTRYGRNKKGEY